MASDMETGIRKVLSLSKELGGEMNRLNADTLKEMMRTFLSGKAKKKGKIAVWELRKSANRHGGKLEEVPISEQNIGDFLDTAKKYDIDFAVKRDTGTGTVHVFFESGDTENFKRAFTEYAYGKGQEIANQPYTSRENLRQTAQHVREEASKKKEKVREKDRDMSL